MLLSARMVARGTLRFVSKRAAGASLLALTTLVIALSVGSVRLDSATSDEPAHIAAGMIKLTTGRLDFFREQPPLMNSLSALPLVAAGYRWPAGISVSTNHWVAGRLFLWYSRLDGHRILFLARLPTIALFVALCWSVCWFVVVTTGSRGWGVAAFALTGLSPTLLAHGRLATVDLAVTLFAFLATALLLRLIEAPALGTAVGLGLATAAAALSKISGLILGPFFVLVIAVAFLLGRTRDRRRFMAMMLIAIVAGVVLAEVVVLGEASKAFLAERFPSLTGPARLLVPFADYAENLRTIQEWYVKGHVWPQYLAGRFSYQSWPQYYTIAWLLKETIPAQILFIIAVALAARRLPRRGGDDPRPFALAVMIAFVLLFMLFAATGKLALGIRYVLPIFPFTYAAAAIALSMAGSRRLAIAAAALVAWHGIEAVIAYPGYLSYFNESIGGNANADRFLIDSNLDWGQDLRRLDRWCAENGVKQIAVHYFGGSEPWYDVRHARVILRYGPLPDPLPRGFFAVSRHFYRISFFPRVWGIDYDTYLDAAGAQYVTTVGGSIRVYRVP